VNYNSWPTIDATPVESSRILENIWHSEDAVDAILSPVLRLSSILSRFILFLHARMLSAIRVFLALSYPSCASKEPRMMERELEFPRREFWRKKRENSCHGRRCCRQWEKTNAPETVGGASPTVASFGCHASRSSSKRTPARIGPTIKQANVCQGHTQKLRLCS